MPALSIIIPCLGDAAEFDGTLVSALQHRPADCEVMVVHRMPYDDPYGLSEEVRFLHWPGGSLVELINAAVAEAEGELLHILGCGLEATEHWTSAAMEHFQDPEVAAVVPVVLDQAADDIVSAGIRWTMGGARREVTDRRVLTPGSGRLRAQIIAPPLTAGFYRREVLSALGGFEASIGDDLADVAYGLCLQSLERLIVFEPTAQIRQVHRPTLGPCSAARHGKAAEALFWRSAAQLGLGRAISWHAFLVASELISADLATTLGRCRALTDLGAGRRYDRALTEARDHLSEMAALRSHRRKRPSPAASASVTVRRAA